MYSKKHRLNAGRSRFRAEKTKHWGSFSIRIAGSFSGRNRFAIVIPKSAIKKATERNFWKRTVADCVKNWANVGKDFLIVVSSGGIRKKTPKSVCGELNEIFKDLISEKQEADYRHGKKV